MSAQAERLRVAAVQLNASDDKRANLERAEPLVAEAAAMGADLVVLPELWNGIGDHDVVYKLAERREDGESVGAMADWARRHGITLIGGSIIESRPGHDLPSNTCFVFGPSGDIIATYRKIHLFDVEAGGVTYEESAVREGGDSAAVCRVGDWTAGLSICYDLRFPELYRVLAVAGAELIAVPAAFTLHTGKDHWELLLRARAVENQSFVVAAGQWGTHDSGWTTYGRSMIIDPWGVVLAQAHDADTVIACDVDRAQIRDVRSRLPALTHRRPDAYHLADDRVGVAV